MGWLYALGNLLRQIYDKVDVGKLDYRLPNTKRRKMIARADGRPTSRDCSRNAKMRLFSPMKQCELWIEKLIRFSLFFVMEIHYFRSKTKKES